MQERHLNRKQYFDEQGITTEKYVIPYIENCMPIEKDTHVLEIGCAEGGNMAPFIARGCYTVGVDLNERQIEKAKSFLSEKFSPAVFDQQVKLVAQDIYKVAPESLGRFDLIVMRDVIEHIFDQERFLHYVKAFLKPGGRIFFGFPPWHMPFGGHQQICHSFLSKTPYIHLLNKHLYKALLNTFNEKAPTIKELLAIKETGITIERFERIMRKENFVTERKTIYLINPNYEIKFGLSPREQLPIIRNLAFIRNFISSCYYTVVRYDHQ